MNNSSTQQLEQVKDIWSRKIKFKLAKNFPIKPFNPDKSNKWVEESRFSGKKSESDRIRELQDQSRQIQDEQSYMNANISYKLVDINQIRYVYDDSVIKLRNILSNQVKQRIREECQEFLDKLNELMYLTNLWHECQYKWQFLETIFATADNPEPVRSLHDHANQEAYYKIVKEFRNFQFRHVENPLVIRIAERPGNRSSLLNWHTKLSTIADDVERELELSCIRFPRFYFLTREQLIKVHSYSKDCRKYFETVRYCFNGVQDLIYSLPTKDNEVVDKLNANTADNNCPVGTTGTDTSRPALLKSLTLLEFDINAHKLEVKGIRGMNGEEFMFFTPLVSYEMQKCSEWFDNMAKIVKSSMFNHVQTYMERIEKYGKYLEYFCYKPFPVKELIMLIEKLG